jgi:hypothetical protein
MAITTVAPAGRPAEGSFDTISMQSRDWAVLRRYSMVIAAAAVNCLALLPVTSAQGAVRAPWAAPRPGSTYSLALRLPKSAGESGHPREPIAGGSLAACEQKLERTQRQHHDGHPLAIVGAPFTAGVGPGNPGESWAADLARRLHWDAVIYGDPGAGYVRAGVGRMGPVAAEIARLDLRALAPALGAAASSGSTRRTARPASSTPRAGSTPATLATSTRTATCSWPAGPMT